MSDQGTLDAVVIGAGFAGIYALYRLRQSGLRVRAYEAGDGVGGTWYWNRYPGCRCDVESLDYSYSFDPDLEQQWTWSERYPSRVEVERYLNHVADRFDLRRDIQLATRVTSAHYDGEDGTWLIATDRGDTVRASFCVTAVGCLSEPNFPEIPGLDSFAGELIHTGAWPKQPVDFTGRRVAILGTGSSGTQAIPEIARQAEHLTVFQRTPHFIVPANNHALDPADSDARKAVYPEHRETLRQGFFGFTIDVNPASALDATPEEREARFEAAWARGGPHILGTYGDLTLNEESNQTLADFFRRKITETVHDPEVARKLCPTTYPVGTKRLVQGTDYYETYNRDNVTLISLLETPIVEITATGIRTTDDHVAVDTIVFATGYDAVTGTLLRIDVRGRDGIRLADAWANGPHTYLGIGVTGFPNLFTITGPGSPSIVSNVVLSIEQHVEWIADCIEHMRAHGLGTIEPTPEAQRAWGEHVADVADRTLFPKANSWYVGANIPGKPRVFLAYLGGVGPYRERCNEVMANGYEGFETLPLLSVR